MSRSHSSENNKDTPIPKAEVPAVTSASSDGEATGEVPVVAPVVEVAPVVPRQTVGDLLHKERVTKRITVETIAKDLRLNVRYIKALEANQYESLPGDPYVRVYLRSIAKYLMLDPETVLQKFYEEKGLAPEHYPRNTQTKLDVTIIDSDSSPKSWLVIGGIIAGLAILVIIIGGITAHRASKAPAVVTPNSGIVDSVKSVAPVVDTAKPDSIMGDSIKEIPPDSGAVSQLETDLVKQGIEPISLEIKVLKDSSWVQAFCDGQGTKNTLKAGIVKRLIARDSINIHVGNSQALQFTLNGKPMPKFPERTMLLFRIGRDGKPVRLEKAKWDLIFAGRL